MKNAAKIALLGVIPLAVTASFFTVAAIDVGAETELPYTCASVAFGTERYTGSDGLAGHANEVVFVNMDGSFEMERCYYGGEGYAVRLGSSGNAGSLTIKFKSPVILKKAKILAYAYDEEPTMYVESDSGFKSDAVIESTEAPDISDSSGDPGYLFTDIDLGNDTDTSSFKLYTSSSKSRINICKVVFTLNQDYGQYFPDGPSTSVDSSSSSQWSSTDSSSTSSSVSQGDVPSYEGNYYSSIDWSRTGASLKSSLSSLISSHNGVGYDGLLDIYGDTDTDDEGYIVDMYSSYRYRPSQNGSNASGEGAGYNREHIVPQSVCSGLAKSDAFNVYPTDIYANNRRSNYPHARVGTTKYTTSNGGKVGTSSTSGYSGYAFEPIDRFKGDIARSYFYTVTAYQSSLSGWKNYAMFSKNAYPSFTSWAIDMLLEWHELDPVDEFEMKRNDAVYTYQKNRNPFIDHPEAARAIWG